MFLDHKNWCKYKHFIWIIINLFYLAVRQLKMAEGSRPPALPWTVLGRFCILRYALSESNLYWFSLISLAKLLFFSHYQMSNKKNIARYFEKKAIKDGHKKKKKENRKWKSFFTVDAHELKKIEKWKTTTGMFFQKFISTRKIPFLTKKIYSLKVRKEKIKYVEKKNFKTKKSKNEIINCLHKITRKK